MCVCLPLPLNGNHPGVACAREGAQAVRRERAVIFSMRIRAAANGESRMRAERVRERPVHAMRMRSSAIAGNLNISNSKRLWVGGAKNASR